VGPRLWWWRAEAPVCACSLTVVALAAAVAAWAGDDVTSTPAIAIAGAALPATSATFTA
jgi:hypothetical protein